METPEFHGVAIETYKDSIYVLNNHGEVYKHTVVGSDISWVNVSGQE